MPRLGQALSLVMPNPILASPLAICRLGQALTSPSPLATQARLVPQPTSSRSK